MRALTQGSRLQKQQAMDRPATGGGVHLKLCFLGRSYKPRSLRPSCVARVRSCVSDRALDSCAPVSEVGETSADKGLGIAATTDDGSCFRRSRLSPEDVL